jgi:23S rRNA (cytidine1920-2'-O)/16S rRNA (cytidine1409-2'-O)-methyltransferase
VTARARLDAELVRRALVRSRRDAAAEIAAGRVLVNGACADKPSRLVARGDAVVVQGPPPRFVSRAGEKLDHALVTFGIEVSGRRALDVGASTGGFTDCLLQHGAAHVVALDVGHGQIRPQFRTDPRVTVVERYNARFLDPDDVGGAADVVAADVSFISLTALARPLVGALVPGGHLVVLVKPQFEAGRQEVARGHGVITDAAIHERVCDAVAVAVAAAGATVLGLTPSPVRGADGNQEFLLWARRDDDAPGGRPCAAP